MKGIYARNVNQALLEGVQTIQKAGKERPSRNGSTLEFDAPVATTYEKPEERVLFWPQRDANPFFHFFEALWMLAGRNDNKFICYFNKGMEKYSDDGLTQNGAYGHRWRLYFLHDQLAKIIELLKKNPMDRRIVLQMWGSLDQLNVDSKDVPCNTNVYFSARNGVLDMTVCNRSNDMIYGCYGANAVHFSMLQEYVAGMTGIPMGRYYQMSNNLHVYTENEAWQRCKALPERAVDYYSLGKVEPYPMVTNPETWDEELSLFMEFADKIIDGDAPNLVSLDNKFFSAVALPMLSAWTHRKDKEFALGYVGHIEASDWRVACQEWMQRRMKNDA